MAEVKFLQPSLRALPTWLPAGGVCLSPIPPHLDHDDSAADELQLLQFADIMHGSGTLLSDGDSNDAVLAVCERHGLDSKQYAISTWSLNRPAPLSHLFSPPGPSH